MTTVRDDEGARGAAGRDADHASSPWPDLAGRLAHLTSLSAEELGQRLAEMLELAATDGERIVVTRDGKPVAAIVPAEDVAWVEDLEDRYWNQEADAALEEAKREGTAPLEQLKSELGL